MKRPEYIDAEDMTVFLDGNDCLVAVSQFTGIKAIKDLKARCEKDLETCKKPSDVVFLLKMINNLACHTMQDPQDPHTYYLLQMN